MTQPLNPGWWLLFFTALLSVWNAGIIWFTHIAVYPLWPLVDGASFHRYHLTWWRRMRPSFGPVALMLLCSIAMLWVRPHGVSLGFLVLGILLQVSVHSLTIFYWAPIQAAMETRQGMSSQKYRQLMSTHWWRVGFFAAHAALMLWLVTSSLSGAMHALFQGVR
jgi:hypothetical protein